MSKVKLIWATPEAEKVVMYCARVSSSNQESSDTRLLNYCLKHGHYSIFEMASMCVEIKTSRAISAQILRHRSFSFQEFCITGDSLITTVMPNGVVNYIPIKKLYERQSWGNYKDIKLRVYDEAKKEFTTANYLEVFKNGKKPVYKVTFEDGKTVTCTKEHKFLTKGGFKPLEDALDLTIEGDEVSIGDAELLATNGQQCYHSYEWMSAAKERAICNGAGVQGIADEAGISYHTVRKWLRKLNLTFTKGEVAKYSEIWNKGKSGYKIAPRTKEQREYMRRITPRGSDHHAYRGGERAERAAVANYFNHYRDSIFERYGNVCQLCNESFDSGEDDVHIHHVKSVSEFPELAYELDNVVPVHAECHREYHAENVIRTENRGNTLAPRYKKVVSVEYAGVEDTYDIHVDHDSHNYVANKVVVHNSQRYAAVVESPITYEARSQDLKNRQNSVDDMSQDDKDWFKDAQDQVGTLALGLYQEALDRGVAKEQARFMLPLSTPTRLYMSGTLRSWIHYLQLRSGNGTQVEHAEIAREILELFNAEFPVISGALKVD